MTQSWIVDTRVSSVTSQIPAAIGNSTNAVAARVAGGRLPPSGQDAPGRRGQRS